MDISAKKYGGTVTAYITGDVDEHSAQKLRTFLDNIIDSESFAKLIIDFGNVDFLDSTGLGMLIGRYKRLREKGIPLFVDGVNSQIDKVFRISGIYQIVGKAR